MSDQPCNVLFLTSAAFNNVTGGGITFSRLFANWPKAQLATVHCDPVPVSHAVCERYYTLSAREIKYFGLIGQRKPPAVNAAPSQASVPAQESFLRRIKRCFFADELPTRIRLSPELHAFINAFRPDVIYTILGNNSMMRFALTLQSQFALPLVIHMMDDWPAVLYRQGWLAWTQRITMHRLLKKTLHRATARLAISEAMCTAFEQRYHHPFVAFQNTLAIEHWHRFVSTPHQQPEPPELVYTGSVLAQAQLASLLDCAAAVDRLNAEGTALRFVIYSANALPTAQQALFANHTHTVLKRTPAIDEAFFRLLAEATLLLLPVNFDKKTETYVRYSMPTKVPAYLVSGTPIVLYGPAQTAQMQYAKHSGWGHCIDEQGEEGLKTRLHCLLHDATLRNSTLAPALTTARRYHDAKQVRHAFQNVLHTAALG